MEAFYEKPFEKGLFERRIDGAGVKPVEVKSVDGKAFDTKLYDLSDRPVQAAFVDLMTSADSGNGYYTKDRLFEFANNWKDSETHKALVDESGKLYFLKYLKGAPELTLAQIKKVKESGIKTVDPAGPGIVTYGPTQQPYLLTTLETEFMPLDVARVRYGQRPQVMRVIGDALNNTLAGMGGKDIMPDPAPTNFLVKVSEDKVYPQVDIMVTDIEPVKDIISDEKYESEVKLLLEPFKTASSSPIVPIPERIEPAQIAARELSSPVNSSQLASIAS